MSVTARKKVLPIIILLLIALISMFVVSGPASSVEFHRSTIATLEEKQATVLGLSAAAMTASVLVSAIPSDVGTPVSEKLADLSTGFLLALGAILLEKYLLTITGMVTFSILIPIACVLGILHVLFDWKSLKQVAIKLTAFGLLIFLVTPASVQISNLIDSTYQTSIEATMEAAEDAAAESGSGAEKEEGSGLSGIVSGIADGVTGAVSGITDAAGQYLNHFIEALAVMLVTCCVIPILVLLSFVWFAKILLSVELPVSFTGLHRGMKGALFGKKAKADEL